jgi:hypothetical protein
MKGGLNLQQMSTHFILEGHLRGCNTQGLMTEDEVVSLSFQMIHAPIIKTSMKKG